MTQQIIVLIIGLCALAYLFKKFMPKRGTLQDKKKSSSNCSSGCSGCSLPRKAKSFVRK